MKGKLHVRMNLVRFIGETISKGVIFLLLFSLLQTYFAPKMSIGSVIYITLGFVGFDFVYNFIKEFRRTRALSREIEGRVIELE